MRADWFDYELPPELIAQHPALRRDQSRLLVLSRSGGRISHSVFSELPAQLRPGDLLVLNDSRVIPARLRGINAHTGTAFEILLLNRSGPNEWQTMMRPGRKARLHAQIQILDRQARPAGILATVTGRNEEGHRFLRFAGVPDLAPALQAVGEVPLPPYIERPAGSDLDPDVARYQTVYAAIDGSIAAPTAGLHFTDALLARLVAEGIEVCRVTLHVGLGTFAPVKAARVSAHLMHEEWYQLGADAAAAINRARAERRRIVAVGTTSVRVLESVAAEVPGPLGAKCGNTRLFIYPPYRFRVVDALLTNFHLPRSTLLMLVSAFAAPGGLQGRAMILGAYAEAVRRNYRFFSYGDAMFIH